MKVAGLLGCLLATAVAVYPESVVVPSKGTAARITQMTTPQVPGYDAPLLTDEMIYGWVKSWQKRLNLEEWKIDARVVRLSQLQKGTVANIHWSLPKRSASIKVLDPLDSNLPRTEVVRDTELSIVHELIHLSLAKLPLDGGDSDLEEETVKRISTALLSLDKHDEERRH